MDEGEELELAAGRQLRTRQRLDAKKDLTARAGGSAHPAGSPLAALQAMMESLQRLPKQSAYAKHRISVAQKAMALLHVRRCVCTIEPLGVSNLNVGRSGSGSTRPQPQERHG